EIVAKIFPTLDVLLHLFPLRISDDNETIHAAQDQLPGRVVNHLARNRIKLKFRHEPFDHDRVQRKKIEKQRALRRGRQRNELPAIQRINPLMDVIQIRRLPAKGRTVVNDFELNLATRVINDRHSTSPAACNCFESFSASSAIVVRVSDESDSPACNAVRQILPRAKKLTAEPL